MSSSHAALSAASRSCRAGRARGQSALEGCPRDIARTILASVMVSAKLGRPFEAKSTSVRGLKSEDVLRKSVLRASVGSCRQSRLSGMHRART